MLQILLVQLNSFNWLKLSCFGHNLHLSVTKSLANDSRRSQALGLCHKIVAAFSGSRKRKRELLKSQINFSLQQHSLISVNLIRHKAYILEQEEALRSILSADREKIHLIPTWQDTDFL